MYGVNNYNLFNISLTNCTN